MRIMESGPAAGVLMSARHGEMLSIKNLLSFDMGGTTAKGALLLKERQTNVTKLKWVECTISNREAD